MSFKRFDTEDIAISAESVVAPLWSTDNPTLTAFFTSSAQIASNTGNYFYTIYDTDINLSANANTARPQMALAFGDKQGRGASPFNAGVTGKSPTSTIYGQYRNLVFGDEETDFAFDGVISDSIYAISLDRSRYKEKLFPGTFELKLTNGANSLYLTDNSNDLTTVSYVDAGRVFEVISGSAGSAANRVTGDVHTTNGSTPTAGSYGKFLPDVGVIILNGNALAQSVGNGGLGMTIDTAASDTARNIKIVYNGIKAGGSFKLQSEETISSNFVFVRVRNSEFNYSTNPSNITGSGELRHDVMINSPQAYITTVGLYNDSNDLLGIAKLSRPLLKDFTKEALIRIKLDY